MKTTPCLTTIALVALAGVAFAGETSYKSYQAPDSASAGQHASNSGRYQDAGTPGAYYRSNFGRNSVLFRNETPHFMTFFIYFGDHRGPNDINQMIQRDAQVFEKIVPPYQTGFIEQKGPHYWVGSRPGKWVVESRGIARR